MQNQNRRTVTLPHRDYQPSQAKMKEHIKARVPGGTVKEKMDNFGRAVTRSVNVRHARK